MSNSRITIYDGIISWYEGPEWDFVVAEAWQELAGDMVSYARSNAPWQDDTGDARAGLDAKVINDGGEVSITLYHTVEYGLWLEVIQSGNFATILPTLEAFSGQIMQAAVIRVNEARRGS